MYSLAVYSHHHYIIPMPVYMYKEPDELISEEVVMVANFKCLQEGFSKQITFNYSLCEATDQRQFYQTSLRMEFLN